MYGIDNAMGGQCLVVPQLTTLFYVTTDAPALTPLFVGAFYIGHLEGWNWSDVIYYCVVTTTSIGYGDLTPLREDTRLFAVIFIPLVRGIIMHESFY